MEGLSDSLLDSTWTVDGLTTGDSDAITHDEVVRRHGELRSSIEARDRAAALHRRELEKYHHRERKLVRRRRLDDLLRLRRITAEQYFQSVEALENSSLQE